MKRLKRCGKCNRRKRRGLFNKNRARAGGLQDWCKHCQKAHHVLTTIPAPARARGERRTPEREGDVVQARSRVNYLVRAGLLPHPKTLACTECGHKEPHGAGRKHEYHHHNGYGVGHHEDVIPVCEPCHKRLTRLEAEAAPRSAEYVCEIPD